MGDGIEVGPHIDDARTAGNAVAIAETSHNDMNGSVTELSEEAFG